MGEYFLYANLDREEFFHPSALGANVRASGVGLDLPGRALGLLLMAREVTRASIRGSWAGTRVVAVGDYTAPDPFGVVTRTADQPERNLYVHAQEVFRDIAPEILRMLLEDAPEALLERARRNDRVFVGLAELVFVRRDASTERFMLEHFGKDWPKVYAKKRAAPR
jgi:hypothetical protein